MKTADKPRGLVASKFFEVIKPWIRLQRASDSAAPRWRIELDPHTPQAIVREALAFQMLCQGDCGRTIHAFRNRIGDGIYFAASCELKVDHACSRRRGPRLEYDQVVEAVKDSQSIVQRKQMPLFGGSMQKPT